MQQFGGQLEAEEGWFVGGAAAYEYTWLDSKDGMVSSNGQGGLGALYIKRQIGPWLFTAAGFGSFGYYETSRRINLPAGQVQADGSPAVYSAGGLLQAAYAFEFGEFYLRPALGLGVVTVHTGAYNENGAGALNLSVQAETQTTFVATPAIEFGGRVNLEDGTVLRPFLGAGVSFLSNSNWQQQAALAGAPAGTGAFVTTIPMNNVVARVSTGVQAMMSERLSLSLQYNGEFSQNVTSQGGSLSVGWQF